MGLWIGKNETLYYIPISKRILIKYFRWILNCHKKGEGELFFKCLGGGGGGGLMFVMLIIL